MFFIEAAALCIYLGCYLIISSSHEFSPEFADLSNIFIKVIIIIIIIIDAIISVDLQWRHELDDILVVALNDTEMWVSMLAETMRTLPSTGSLNLEIRHNDDNQRIFSDLVNDLRKLGKKCFPSIFYSFFSFYFTQCYGCTWNL